MNKQLFLTAIAAVMISAASCGGQQPKTTASETTDATDTLAVAPQPSEEQQPSGMTDKAFSELLLNVIYRLPTSVMPDYLKTEEQRRDVVTKYVGNDDYVNPTVFSHEYENEYYTRYDWMMAGYLTEDNRNIVLIVQYGSYLDGYSLMSDKTLNYDIESQKFTEIERPMEMPTVDEMVVESNFTNQQFYQKAKAFFSKKMKFHYRDFDRDGFIVYMDVWDFYEKNYSVYDEYVIDAMIAFYKWDGNRFYKDKIVNSSDLF